MSLIPLEPNNPPSWPMTRMCSLELPGCPCLPCSPCPPCLPCSPCRPFLPCSLCPPCPPGLPSSPDLLSLPSLPFLLWVLEITVEFVLELGRSGEFGFGLIQRFHSITAIANSLRLDVSSLDKLVLDTTGMRDVAVEKDWDKLLMELWRSIGGAGNKVGLISKRYGGVPEFKFGTVVFVESRKIPWCGRTPKNWRTAFASSVRGKVAERLFGAVTVTVVDAITLSVITHSDRNSLTFRKFRICYNTGM